MKFQLNIVTRPTYPEHSYETMVVVPFVLPSIVIVTLLRVECQLCAAKSKLFAHISSISRVNVCDIQCSGFRPNVLLCCKLLIVVCVSSV